MNSKWKFMFVDRAINSALIPFWSGSARRGSQAESYAPQTVDFNEPAFIMSLAIG
jgi:hypothetical protein